MKDFFISYTADDTDWAEWVAWQLEDKGYSTLLQAWDFLPGSNFVQGMQDACIYAQKTLAILSKRYLQKLFTQSEWAAAFASDPTGELRKLIPVRVDNCNLQGLLSQIVYIDLADAKNEEEALTLLLKGVSDIRICIPSFN